MSDASNNPEVEFIEFGGKLKPVERPKHNSGCVKTEHCLKAHIDANDPSTKRPPWDNNLYIPQDKLRKKPYFLPEHVLKQQGTKKTQPNTKCSYNRNQTHPCFVFLPDGEQRDTSNGSERNCGTKSKLVPLNSERSKSPVDYRYPLCPTKTLNRTQCFRTGPNEPMQCYDDSNSHIIDYRTTRTFCHPIPSSSSLGSHSVSSSCNQSGKTDHDYCYSYHEMD